MFDVTSFPAILSGIGRHFNFCRYLILTTQYLKAAVVGVLGQTHPWHVHILHENIASLVVVIPEGEGRRAQPRKVRVVHHAVWFLVV